jgi:hypothetical protein
MEGSVRRSSPDAHRLDRAPTSVPDVKLATGR